MDRALADMKQCLIHHLQNTAKEALNFAKDLYLEIISQRLYVVSEGTLKLHPTSLRRIIHVSSLLHDIGKAADQYQNQFTRCISNPNFKPSFLLHEVPSAVICYRFACTLNAEDEEIFFMTFSTLNHMNAMRPLQKIKLLLKQMYNKNWSFLRWGSSMLPIFEE
ncbi:MAG: HD domain-containing protein, partial [Nitrososphaerota archaeon]